MMWFWIIALALALAAGGWLIRPLIARTEAAGVDAPAGAGRARGLALSVLAAVPLVALALYLAVGRPEFATGALMKAQQEMRTYARLVDELKARVAERPDDPEGHRLLATSLARLGRYGDAAPEYREAIARGVKTAEIYAGLGEALALTEKEVTPEAMAAFDQALALDPEFQQALYYRAGGYLAQGDPVRAIADWTKLAALAPSDSGLAQALQRNIAMAQRMVPEGAAGIAALPPEQRQSAIAGMVAGLAQKLDAEPADGPHDLEGWVKLVRSYKVLGEADKGAAALAKAKAYFANDAEALKRIDEAAQS